MLGPVTDAPAAHNQRLVLPSRLNARSAARRTWLLVLGAVAITAGAITYYRWPRSGGAAVYRTSPLERRTITRVIEATGQVDVESRIEVAPSASGSWWSSSPPKVRASKRESPSPR